MKREYASAPSPLLKREMETLRFGHGGQHWLVFPTARGRFFDWENFGMIEALQEPLERGWLQLTCLDSVDSAALYGRRIKPWFKIWKHNLYDRYVREEVVPRLDSPFLGTAGASFGAYHAVNFALRHPDAISKVVAMSGVYDLRFRLGQYSTKSVYFHNPLAYLPGLRDERLARMSFHLGVARDEPFVAQHVRLAQLLDQRGAHVHLDISPWGGHDWRYWSQFTRAAV